MVFAGISDIVVAFEIFHSCSILHCTDYYKCPAPYIPMAEARGFTALSAKARLQGALAKKESAAIR
jgi:hypothetical protein